MKLGSKYLSLYKEIIYSKWFPLLAFNFHCCFKHSWFKCIYHPIQRNYHISEASRAKIVFHRLEWLYYRCILKHAVYGRLTDISGNAKLLRSTTCSKLTFDMDGYFHTMIWFWEYPCVLTSSFTFLHQARLQTCNRKQTMRIEAPHSREVNSGHNYYLPGCLCQLSSEHFR